MFKSIFTHPYWFYTDYKLYFIIPRIDGYSVIYKLQYAVVLEITWRLHFVVWTYAVAVYTLTHELTCIL